MSYTTIVKNEISKIKDSEIESVSKLSAIVNSTNQSENMIKIITENNSVARKIYSDIKSICQIQLKITVRKGYNYNKKLLYILETPKKDIILKKLEINKNWLPNEDILSDDELKKAYLNGIFLMCGSINDPKKSRYHLEFSFNNYSLACLIKKLLNHFYLNSKLIKRDNKYMVYIKEAEKISDFLRIINATKSLFYFEDIRIYRDHKNMTNRLNNCEQANVDKIIQTATDQVQNINTIIENGGLDLLDERTKIAAIYRKKYTDVSITELSEIISIETGHNITKSGLYHRLKKINILANKINQIKD